MTVVFYILAIIVWWVVPAIGPRVDFGGFVFVLMLNVMSTVFNYPMFVIITLFAVAERAFAFIQTRWGVALFATFETVLLILIYFWTVRFEQRGISIRLVVYPAIGVALLYLLLSAIRVSENEQKGRPPVADA